MAKEKGKGKSKGKGKGSGKGSEKGSKKNKKGSKSSSPVPVEVPLTNLDKFNLLVSQYHTCYKEPRKLSLPTNFNDVQPKLRRFLSTPTLLPSYAYDLDELCRPYFYGVPAFKADDLHDKPHVCLWQFFTKEDAQTLLDVWDIKEDSIEFLASKLPEEPAGIASDLLLELLYDTLNFSRVQKMSGKKTAALLSIVYLTHDFFRSSLWRTAEETYSYVKEAFLLHTVLRPSKSAEIFDPEECRLGLVHFCKMYLRHLPLVQLAMLPNHRLRLEWEPEPPPPIDLQAANKQDDAQSQKSKKSKSKGEKKEKGGEKGKKGGKKKK